MAPSFYGYLFANFGISIAILIIIGVVLIFFILHTIDWSDDQKDANKNGPTTNDSVVTTTPVQLFNQPTESATTTTDDPKSKENQRLKYKKNLLDLYGKLIDGDKRRNLIFLTIIIVAGVGTTCVAFIQGCIIVNITVYPGGPCPSYGTMDCYSTDGGDYIYFSCNPGDNINSTQFNSSATCFRWIARDVSVNDVVTQIGACAGLLHALCAFVQLLIRFLIYAWSKHKQTLEELAAAEANGCMPPQTKDTEQMSAEKSTYINDHPYLLIISYSCLILIPVAIVITAVILGVFRISTTALTYIILCSIGLILICGFIWVLQTEINLQDNKELTTAIEHFRKSEISEKNKAEKEGFSKVTEDFSKDDFTPIFDMMRNKK